jgi:predicted membrane-bound spermidine synthase
VLPRGVASGLALISAATLGLEVALTRVLSVSLWYHFAFLVVSTAVVGFGLSGVVLTISRRLREGGPARLPLWAGAYAASIVLAFALCNALPFDPFALLSERRQLALLPVYYAALTAPFYLAGTTVALILMRSTAAASRLYAWDLGGAGVGAALVVAAFGPLGGSGTVLACAAVAAAGAACLGLGVSRRAVAAGAALAVACGALALAGERVLPVRVTENKLVGEAVPVARLLADPTRRLLTRWNALGRIDVVRGARGRRILIDGGVAVTRLPEARPPFTRYAGTPSSEWLAFPLRPRARVLVIGSGGGWEVLGALAHGAREVTAVEVNPAVNAIVTRDLADHVGRLFADPRVRLVTDEGRAFLRRTRARYDVIVSAHTISNAATASGAMSLAESYTLTAEAFADYLAHLEEGGVLLFTRPEAHLPRLFATARGALAGAGLEPARCLAAARGAGAPGRSFDGVFLMRRGPIDAALAAQLGEAFARARLTPLYLPGDPSGPEIYRRLLTAPDPEAVYRAEPRNLRPATDDRPFFNQHLRWAALRPGDLVAVFRQGAGGRLALEDAPVAETALLVFLAQAALLGVVVLLAPLGALRRQGVRRGGRAAFLAYFGLLGLGYMLVELGLVQRLTLFVGPPTVTFAVVVGGLLVASGLGSRVSARLVPARALPAVLLAGAVVVALVALGAPLVARAALGAPLAVRAALGALLVVPVGLALGAPFPLGLRLAGARAPALVPWLWGVNGFASVLASAGSLLWATAFGFTAVLLTGVGAYLLALGAVLLLGRGATTAAEDARDAALPPAA